VFRKAFAILIVSVSYIAVYGCAESRQDPCELLSAFEVTSIDADVEYSVWAGQEERKRENEVCMYYTTDGDPKVMLFVWYDKSEDPEALVRNQGAEANLEVVRLPEAESEAVAAFSDSQLKLLAVKTTGGVAGIRIRKPVTKGDPELLEIVQMAETALSRN
jgi:hypothetical protein